MIPTPPAKPVIGLVGGVGAGKSTAAAAFAALGCALIDADEIGYELLAEPDVRNQLRKRWGRRVFSPDGSVNREALAEIVFQDAAQLDALNDIMQDRIGRRIAQRIEQGQDDPDASAVVLDAAIMFEAAWDKMCTHVLFVSAPPAQRAARAAAKGLHEKAWRRRENSQISLDTKQTKCYCSLDNSSSAAYLREQVRGIFQRVVHQADRSSDVGNAD